mmetsp:Transcript_39067/g.54484  ORF Transcript_39067/g.54484 Transcript_39067/m.54484 type:complete len:249 (-) Transcript_39067:806-1552(-)
MNLDFRDSLFHHTSMILFHDSLFHHTLMTRPHHDSHILTLFRDSLFPHTLMTLSHEYLRTLNLDCFDSPSLHTDYFQGGSSHDDCSHGGFSHGGSSHDDHFHGGHYCHVGCSRGDHSHDDLPSLQIYHQVGYHFDSHAPHIDSLFQNGYYLVLHLDSQIGLQTSHHHIFLRVSLHVSPHISLHVSLQISQILPHLNELHQIGSSRDVPSHVFLHHAVPFLHVPSRDVSLQIPDFSRDVESFLGNVVFE